MCSLRADLHTRADIFTFTVFLARDYSADSHTVTDLPTMNPTPELSRRIVSLPVCNRETQLEGPAHCTLLLDLVKQQSWCTAGGRSNAFDLGPQREPSYSKARKPRPVSTYTILSQAVDSIRSLSGPPGNVMLCIYMLEFLQGFARGLLSQRGLPTNIALLLLAACFLFLLFRFAVT